MPVSEETYRRVALEADDGHWELHEGCLRKKPPMTTEHNLTYRRLARQLSPQLDPDDWEIFVDNGRVRRPDGGHYIPDLFVAPMDAVRRLLATPRTFEVYEEPLPLVVEVWSPSTGEYDVVAKLAVYKERGDLEVWLIHPYDRTLVRHRRQPNGSYPETVYRGGTIHPTALPNVTIDLDALFA